MEHVGLQRRADGEKGRKGRKKSTNGKNNGRAEGYLKIAREEASIERK